MAEYTAEQVIRQFSYVLAADGKEIFFVKSMMLGIQKGFITCSLLKMIREKRKKKKALVLGLEIFISIHKFP
jgi:hypothetical protein